MSTLGEVEGATPTGGSGPAPARGEAGEAAPLRVNPVLLIFRAIRLHQWSKNLLLFVPIISAHQLWNGQAVLDTLVAFCVWGLMASAIYLLNDVYDIEADRRHPHKRSRPLASGQMRVSSAILMAMILGIAAVVLAESVLNVAARWWLFGYAGLSMTYLFFLKRLLLVDVLALASLYTMRIMAGGAAAEIVISHWLLAFSMFFFTSIALAKRFTELATQLRREPQPQVGEAEVPAPFQAHGRAYDVRDLDVLRVAGVVAGYLAILVLAQYLASPEMARLYRRAEILWLVCPLLAYWITRLWFIANRGQLHHDPVVFALRDSRSYIVGALCAAAAAAATLWPAS